MPFYCGKRFTGICVVLGPNKSSTYSSEYTSGLFEPAASHLPASPSPRNEGLLRQTPSLRSSETGETCGKGAIRSSDNIELRTSNIRPHASRASHAHSTIPYKLIGDRLSI